MDKKVALIVLNTEINFDIEKYWLDSSVSIKICADGGATRLNTYNQNNKFKRLNFNYIFILSLLSLITSFFYYQFVFLTISLLLLLLNVKDNKFVKLVPDLIIGDMDSYKGFNSKVIKIEDQDTTDFTKCVTYIEKHFKVDKIIVIGGFGGRFDHECANMQTILKSQIKIVMIDKDNYICKINIGDNIFTSNGYCGLIPFTKSKVKTKGFQWDVDQEIEFGGLISTSNNAIGNVHINLEYGLCLFWKSNT